MKLHILTEEGLTEFRYYLNGLRTGEIADLDRDNLFTENLSIQFEKEIEMFDLKVNSKKEFIIELIEMLKDINLKENYYNVELWSWISVYYFDIVCPKINDLRKPGADDRHILNPDNWQRYYRHLIAAPIRLYLELRELAIGYLDGSPNTHGEFFEQLASSQELATSPSVIEAANILFWDNEKKEFKRGSRGKNKPGTIRRYARDIIPQFQMTYDLNSMSGEEIIELLPDEFSGWLE